MRLTYCITRSDTIGGAHVHVADLAALATKLGHDVSAIVGGVGPFNEVLKNRGVPVHVSRFLRRPVRPLADAAAILELRRIFKTINPQLISLHSAKAGILGRLAARNLGPAVLFTVHGWSFTEGVAPGPAHLYRRLERITANMADRIVTVSDYDRDLALRASIADPDHIITIHNGMPMSERTASPGQCALPVRLTMLARLDVPKDHSTLFQALAQLDDLPWSLDLIGDGPLEKTLRKLASELAIEQQVRFLGFRSNVEDILVNSHIFILTSNWEGFPRSILEAMRAGLPVIASDVGGVREAVEDTRTGYLVPRRGTQQLADRLRYLIEKPKERERLGQAGRTRFVARFQFERMAHDTFELYERLVGNGA